MFVVWAKGGSASFKQRPAHNKRALQRRKHINGRGCSEAGGANALTMGPCLKRGGRGDRRRPPTRWHTLSRTSGRLMADVKQTLHKMQNRSRPPRPYPPTRSKADDERALCVYYPARIARPFLSRPSVGRPTLVNDGPLRFRLWVLGLYISIPWVK